MTDRLSKMDLLPDAAVPALQSAYDQVMARRRTQQDIYEDLLTAIAKAGVRDRPSFSSFNRWAVKARLHKVRRPAAPDHADVAAPPGPAELIASAIEADIASMRTRTLLATALRSLADDLERQGQG